MFVVLQTVTTKVADLLDVTQSTRESQMKI